MDIGDGKTARRSLKTFEKRNSVMIKNIGLLNVKPIFYLLSISGNYLYS